MYPFTTQFGIGVNFQGAMHGTGNYLIQGEVVGDGDIEGTVVLASGAYWKGNLNADYVRIEGKLEGDITARSKVELTSTAVVTGNLSARLIAIEEGSTYQGTINRPRKTQVTRYSERRGKGEPNRPV
jgi:cytoskeletal protein CcmA (bactofilin family)